MAVYTPPPPQLDSEATHTPRSAVYLSGRMELLALLALCLVLSVARWCTLNSFWGDSPRWIFEAYRAATGEWMYRDFAWQYPPLPLLLCAGAMRLGGFTFGSLQLLLDVISAIVVLLTWDVARRFLPRPLPLLIAAAMACAGASNTSNFALFSLQVYTPAILVGLAGLLLTLRETIDYLETGTMTAARLGRLALGAAVGLLSKPEYIIGVAGCLAALALCDLRLHFRARPFSAWFVHYVKVMLACVVPALAVYGVFAAAVGPANLIAGVSGYGLASLSCPWWPTGLGVFGAVAALGYGVLDLALLSLTRFRAFSARYGRRYPLLWVAAAVSLAVAVLYLPYCAELPMFAGRVTLAHSLTYFVSTGTLLLPVMWFAIAIALVLAVKLLRSSQGISLRDAIVFVAVSSAALMSLRGLFNGTMTQLTLASVAAYPIWFILGPYWLVRFLQSTDRKTEQTSFRPLYAPLSVVAVVAVFFLLRLAGVVVGEVKPHWAKVATAAGTVRVRDTSESPAVYAFIQSHLTPGEALLDVAGGGGMNVGDRRPSPLFSTQWTALAPPAHYLSLDRQLLAEHPPRLIIASTGDNFGATFGICMNTGCTFPQLVWSSHRPACDLSKTFPALDYVRDHYAPLATFGDKVIYSLR